MLSISIMWVLPDPYSPVTTMLPSLPSSRNSATRRISSPLPTVNISKKSSDTPCGGIPNLNDSITCLA